MTSIDRSGLPVKNTVYKIPLIDQVFLVKAWESSKMTNFNFRPGLISTIVQQAGKAFRINSPVNRFSRYFKSGALPNTVCWNTQSNDLFVPFSSIFIAVFYLVLAKFTICCMNYRSGLPVQIANHLKYNQSLKNILFFFPESKSVTKWRTSDFWHHYH